MALLSRIADTLYWMSRYLERVDNTARLLEINLLHLVEAEEGQPGSAPWRPLLAISGSEEAFAERHPGAEMTAARVIRFLTQERGNSNAIHPSLRLARENARVVRDRISKEMWQALNDLWLGVDRRLKTALRREQAAAFYASLRSEVARFHGLTDSTMVRGEAHAFYRLGTLVERADMSARILDVKYHTLLPDLSMVGSPLDYYQWAALLKSLSGFEAYRRQYHGGLRPGDVAEFVVFEASFPRSLRFCVEGIGEALRTVSGEAPPGRSGEAVRELSELLGVSTATVLEQGIHEFLERFIAQVAGLNAALGVEYFEVYPEADRCAM